MKKISAKEFFTTMWRGVCQALGWVFGLFGYQRDGKFAKCVWGMFALSGAVVMAAIAITVLYGAYRHLSWYWDRYHGEDSYYESTYISRDISFFTDYDGNGFVCNKHTGEQTLKDVVWVAKPADGDSLVCYSNGKKRGYFNRYTGKSVIAPKYERAWIFSDGLAAVEEDGYVKFIDGTGKVVIDKKMRYNRDMDGYVFHGGYCVVDDAQGGYRGLMDRAGNIVLPVEYTSIRPENDMEIWLLEKVDEMGVVDKNMRPVLPLKRCHISIWDEKICVTLPDHTIQQYDMQGNLINDFLISTVRMLVYDKEEILTRTTTHDENGEEYAVPIVESYHPLATARLRSYIAGDGYEGLMTADGHRVTMPLYKNIEAIGYDLYLCELSYENMVVLNGKGEIVR